MNDRWLNQIRTRYIKAIDFETVDDLLESIADIPDLITWAQQAMSDNKLLKNELIRHGLGGSDNNGISLIKRRLNKRKHSRASTRHFDNIDTPEGFEIGTQT